MRLKIQTHLFDQTRAPDAAVCADSPGHAGGHTEHLHNSVKRLTSVELKSATMYLTVETQSSTYWKVNN